MHKIFAKTLFLGKNVIFLPQCHSTNDEMLSRMKIDNLREGAILISDFQTSGKGQRGNKWVGEPGKNLMMSVLLKPSFLPISRQYLLTVISGLAIYEALKDYPLQEVYIKWPNDIYVNGNKLAGILAEASISGNTLETVVVGIGINVNQNSFADDLKATSLMLETGQLQDRTYFNELVLLGLEKWYLQLQSGNINSILEAYHDLLMWKNELHQFESNGDYFEGMIKGINKTGNLIIECGQDEKTFSIKELSFVR
jgi:BirA family biotin operon repressor/biotin-[acetyl-CoA-carboxylase] ligase